MTHRWLILLSILGLALGITLALALPSLLMQASEAQTGHDAGNAGILFCFTLPTFPPLGLALGTALGLHLDHRNNPKR